MCPFEHDDIHPREWLNPKNSWGLQCENWDEPVTKKVATRRTIENSPHQPSYSALMKDQGWSFNMAPCPAHVSE
jgi:hypothetical protein